MKSIHDESDLTYRLSRLEVAGVQFVETDDGQLRIIVPGDLDDDHRSQLAYLRRRYRDDVARLVASRSEWVRVWESYVEGDDIVAWADELCRIGEAGGMVCHHAGGWNGLRRFYRELEMEAGDDEKRGEQQRYSRRGSK